MVVDTPKQPLKATLRPLESPSQAISGDEMSLGLSISREDMVHKGQFP